jgi:sugar phosphate isomerase/epimerase
MTPIKIGIGLDSLGLPLRSALQEVERLGVTGVEVAAVGDLAPAQLSQTGRREFRHLLRGHNLELTALSCPLRRGLDAPENQEGRIDHVKNVLALSYELGPRVVIVQAGKVPKTEDDPSFGLMRDALAALAAHGDRVGATLALDTGLDAGEDLANFLARFDTGSLGVNYDPANLLVNGFSPYDSARALAGRIVHVHARDARKAGPSRAAQEVPLGHGDIDWMYLAGLFEEMDYHGWLTIVRDTGSQRRQDIASGVGLLRRIVG